MSSRDVSPWALRGLYLFALVLVLSPMLDFGATIWPARPGELAWRYGFFGLMAGYLQTPLLGLLIALGVGHWQRDSTVVKTLGILMLGGSVLLVAAMGLFMLDVVQVRAIRTEDVQGGILVGAALQEIKYGMAVVVTAVLGLGSIKTAAGYGAHTGGKGSPGIVSSSG